MDKKIKELSAKLIGMFNADMAKELAEIKKDVMKDPADHKYYAKSYAIRIWTEAEQLLTEYMETIEDD